MVLRWRCTVNKSSINAKWFQSIIRFASVAFSHAPALVCFYVCKRRCSWDYDTRTFRDSRLSILRTWLHKFLGSFLLLKEFVCFRTNWLSSFSSYSKNCHLMLWNIVSLNWPSNCSLFTFCGQQRDFQLYRTLTWSLHGTKTFHEVSVGNCCKTSFLEALSFSLLTIFQFSQIFICFQDATIPVN